jgi:phage shock protein PspC (stress-responsive transcriptional regulator)
MSNFIRKLTSRKLWMAIAGVATGIALALGADASEIQTVTGAVTALISAVVYIITEGKVDAESVKNAVEGAQNAVDAIGGDEE